MIPLFFLSFPPSPAAHAEKLTSRSDYDVFLSPLADFKAEMTKAGFDDKVVYLDRGDQFEFEVRGPKST